MYSLKRIAQFSIFFKVNFYLSFNKMKKDTLKNFAFRNAS